MRWCFITRFWYAVLWLVLTPWLWLGGFGKGGLTVLLIRTPVSCNLDHPTRNSLIGCALLRKNLFFFHQRTLPGELWAPARGTLLLVIEMTLSSDSYRDGRHYPIEPITDGIRIKKVWSDNDKNKQTFFRLMEMSSRLDNEDYWWTWGDYASISPWRVMTELVNPILKIF